MSFRITPEDVGRKFYSVEGHRYVFCGVHNVDLLIKSDMEDNATINKYRQIGQELLLKGNGEYINHGFFIDRWADEPATDQVADQVRPKDLRDGFAMVAMGAIITAMPHTPRRDGIFQDGETLSDMVSRNAYAYADSMMKARGK